MSGPVTVLESTTPLQLDGAMGERVKAAFVAMHQVQLLCARLLDHFEGDLDEQTFVAKACASRAYALTAAASTMLCEDEEREPIDLAQREIDRG